MNSMLKQFKYYLNLLIESIHRMIFNQKNFGLKIAIINILGEISSFYLIKFTKIGLYIRNKHGEIIYSYLENKYSDLIEEYKNIEVKNGKNCKKIWSMWWQGLNEAPPVVKKSINSIKQHSGDYELIIITKDNYKEYTNIPQKIIEKCEEGKITQTHLSDIIRLNLLSLNGGIWVDATLFICGNVFKEFDNKILNTAYVGNEKFAPWTGFFIGGTQNKFFSFCNDLLIRYNLEYDIIINYFLIDYSFRIAYNNFEECKRYIDDANLEHPDVFYFINNFTKPFNEKEFEKKCDEYDFYKLSYKPTKNNKNYDSDGNITYWGYFSTD